MACRCARADWLEGYTPVPSCGKDSYCKVGDSSALCSLRRHRRLRSCLFGQKPPPGSRRCSGEETSSTARAPTRSAAERIRARPPPRNYMQPASRRRRASKNASRNPWRMRHSHAGHAIPAACSSAANVGLRAHRRAVPAARPPPEILLAVRKLVRPVPRRRAAQPLRQSPAVRPPC